MTTQFTPGQRVIWERNGFKAEAKFVAVCGGGSPAAEVETLKGWDIAPLSELTLSESLPAQGEQMDNTVSDEQILELAKNKLVFGMSLSSASVIAFARALLALKAEQPEAPDDSVTVRYDLSAAETDDRIKSALVAMGWTPPGEQPAAQGEPVVQHAATVADVHMSRYTLEWNGSPLPEGTKLYTHPSPAAQVPEGWKHDCSALLTNDIELWVGACPHCGKPRPASPKPPAQAVEQDVH